MEKSLKNNLVFLFTIDKYSYISYIFLIIQKSDIQKLFGLLFINKIVM